MAAFVTGGWSISAAKSRGKQPRVCRIRAAANPVEVDAEGWNRVVKDVGSKLELSEDDAEQLALRAFGWGKQVYWQNKKEMEIPSDEVLQERMNYLEEILGDDQAFVTKFVQKFPEALGLDVESSMKKNVDALRKQYRMDDKRIRQAVSDLPIILGFQVDCMGDCIGECNRCWARF